MKAAVLEKPGKLVLKDVKEPTIKKPNEVILKIEVASICGTDIQILNVPPGHPAKDGAILGHEFMGKVVELGSEVKEFKIGDRVVVDPEIICDSCIYCKSGMPIMCENRETLGITQNGGFAEYAVAPENVLFKISDKIKPELAVLTNLFACIVSSLSKIKLFPAQDILILGAGPIGLMNLLFFRSSGARQIIVSEINNFRMNFAKQIGANAVINPNNTDIVEEVHKITDIGVDICVDAVGSLMDVAISSVKKNGTVLLMGMNSKAKPSIQQNSITKNNIKIIGSLASEFAYPETIKIIESNILPLEKLITHKIQLDAILDGIELMKSGKAIKVLVYP